MHSFWISRGLSLIKALGGPLPTNRMHKVASVGGTFVTINEDVAGAERSGDFVVAAVAATAAVAAVAAVAVVVDVVNDADNVADSADDVLGDSFIFGGLVWFV